MRKLHFLWTLLASALFVVGCSKSDSNTDTPTPDPVPGAKPEITLTEVEATYNTFTFKATTTIAGTLGYAIAPEGSKTPTFDEMFAANSVELTNEATLTVENLNDNTSYTLYAVLRATADNSLSAPKNLKFTTPDDGKVNPVVIDNATYDTITFTINIAGSYIFQCIDAAYLQYNNLLMKMNLNGNDFSCNWGQNKSLKIE